MINYRLNNVKGKLFFILKSIIFLISFITVNNSNSYANPIPVFCLAGWIDNCKGYTGITEYEYAGTPLKTYSLSGVGITEYEYAGAPLKTYSVNHYKLKVKG